MTTPISLFVLTWFCARGVVAFLPIASDLLISVALSTLRPAPEGHGMARTRVRLMEVPTNSSR